MKNIKFSINNISQRDINNVNKVIKSGWLTHGKYTKLFETGFSNFVKSEYAVSVSSCTAGLHLACIAAGFKLGDEVIVPAMSHTATSHAVEYTGATAVFSDVEKISGNINLNFIKKCLTKKTKGIIIVHMAGLPCEVDKIANFCKKNNLILIEDCAHALGSVYKKKHVGNFGFAGVFSFYPTKQITTGEGGIVITSNPAVYKKIKKLKAFGIDTDVSERKIVGSYDVKELGYNYRMTDFQAALGYGQMINYKKKLIIRKKIAKRYIKNFCKYKNILYTPFTNNNSYFVFQIFCKNRNKVLEGLKKKNIGVSVHYMKPLPMMSYYKKKYNLPQSMYKNANEYANANISLPIYSALKNSEIDFICKKIIKLIRDGK